jgi:hypothetical protein
LPLPRVTWQGRRRWSKFPEFITQNFRNPQELFAAAGDDQRRDFLAALRGLRADPRCVLVFTLRADFYGAFMTSSLWTDNDGRISRIDLGPPGSDSLRVVIERPARDLGVYVQPELVSLLLNDAAREPGALPLLQETLFQLWSKRRERLLALADYQALSHGARTGLAFAVEKHAEFVLGRLTSAQQVTAFRILLRLVNFGEGRADTRRQQPRDALRSEGDAAGDAATGKPLSPPLRHQDRVVSAAFSTRRHPRRREVRERSDRGSCTKMCEAA